MVSFILLRGQDTELLSYIAVEEKDTKGLAKHHVTAGVGSPGTAVGPLPAHL